MKKVTRKLKSKGFIYTLKKRRNKQLHKVRMEIMVDGFPCYLIRKICRLGYLF